MPDDNVFRFDSSAEAERVLIACGFSVGRTQRDDPRGVMFGDWDIQKWRNLRKSDRDTLDGILTRVYRSPDSAVVLALREACPMTGRRALLAATA